jgi:L-serine dehydratase
MKIVRIDNIEVEFTGEYSTLIVHQQDKPGVIAHITQALSEQNVNIAFMRLFREKKGENAYTVVESDEHIPEEILDKIRTNPNVDNLMLIQM